MSTHVPGFHPDRGVPSEPERGARGSRRNGQDRDDQGSGQSTGRAVCGLQLLRRPRLHSHGKGFQSFFKFFVSFCIGQTVKKGNLHITHVSQDGWLRKYRHMSEK